MKWKLSSDIHGNDLEKCWEDNNSIWRICKVGLLDFCSLIVTLFNKSPVQRWIFNLFGLIDFVWKSMNWLFWENPPIYFLYSKCHQDLINNLARLKHRRINDWPEVDHPAHQHHPECPGQDKLNQRQKKTALQKLSESGHKKTAECGNHIASWTLSVCHAVFLCLWNSLVSVTTRIPHLGAGFKPLPLGL